MLKTLKDTPAVNIEANKTCMMMNEQTYNDHEKTIILMHTERLQTNVTVRK